MKNKRKKDAGAAGFFAASIPLIGFIIFSFIPLILSTFVSFFEIHRADFADMKWVGINNFIEILTDQTGRFYPALLTTVIFAINAPISIALGLYIANLLNKINFMKRIFRSIFFIPYVCSTVVVALTFKVLFRNQSGVVNGLLDRMGFENVEWLTSSPQMFLGITIVMVVWKGLGYTILLYQAALANVGQHYYEAAKIDGASSFQIFWKITWPAISPTTGFLVTMRIIGALQAMTETYMLVSGPGVVIPTWGDGTALVSDTATKFIYDAIFTRSYAEGFGFGAAGGWILAILVFVITRVNLKLQERWVCYDF